MKQMEATKIHKLNNTKVIIWKQNVSL